jgi:hypothetical protein
MQPRLSKATESPRPIGNEGTHFVSRITSISDDEGKDNLQNSGFYLIFT